MTIRSRQRFHDNAFDHTDGRSVVRLSTQPRFKLLRICRVPTVCLMMAWANGECLAKSGAAHLENRVLRHSRSLGMMMSASEWEHASIRRNGVVTIKQ